MNYDLQRNILIKFYTLLRSSVSNFWQHLDWRMILIDFFNYVFIFVSVQDWHGIISSSLGGILLLGTSTLIGIVLIIDSEMAPRKSPTANLSSGMLRSAIGLSWFMPTLYAVTTPLVYTIVGNWPIYWWMPVNSVGFILFIVIETLFVIIFSLLFLTLIRKLTYLKNKQDKHKNSVCKRCVCSPTPLRLIHMYTFSAK